MTEPLGMGGRWRGLALALAALGLMASTAAVGNSMAAFSDTTNNPGNSFSAAASFCASPGAQTVIADADSYVDENAPASNYGNSTSVQIQSRQGGRNRRVLVHFPLPAAPFCSVTSATLRLYANAAKPGRTLQAYQAATPWTEGTVNWLTQPPTTGSPSTTTSATGWGQFDVTAQVQSLFAVLNTGFVVRDSVEDENPASTQQFSSRDAPTYRPELVITLA
ncbi:MAG TPA: DNRLRE domain-containing protein [Actinomycetota bacterium]|jgi:hypothetical protein|nr:DNRLRE domain-containing protein [Actinomycetota bacterium]